MRDSAGNVIPDRVARSLPTFAEMVEVMDADSTEDIAYDTDLTPEMVAWIDAVHATLCVIYGEWTRCDVVPFTGGEAKLMQSAPESLDVLLRRLELLGQPAAFRAVEHHVLTSSCPSRTEPCGSLEDPAPPRHG
jgi:Asp-tRNA(Asn)/Glu-tRNA(Gln) amidotransferase C subunit